jgi:hypothetical protein
MKPTKEPGKERGKERGNEQAEKSDLLTQKGACLTQKRDIDPKSAKKRAFIKAYNDSLFNISQACRLTGLNRKTFYRWKDSDPDFLEDLKLAEEDLKDYLRSKLLKLVDEGNLIACIFACKSLGGLVEGTKADITINKGDGFDQKQLDALVRGASIDRNKYEDMLQLNED